MNIKNINYFTSALEKNLQAQVIFCYLGVGLCDIEVVGNIKVKYK